MERWGRHSWESSPATRVKVDRVKHVINAKYLTLPLNPDMRTTSVCFEVEIHTSWQRGARRDQEVSARNNSWLFPDQLAEWLSKCPLLGHKIKWVSCAASRCSRTQWPINIQSLFPALEIKRTIVLSEDLLQPGRGFCKFENWCYDITDSKKKKKKTGPPKNRPESLPLPCT